MSWILRKGETYRCQNRECTAELRVTNGSIEGSSGLRCCCGSPMKKPYHKPQLRVIASTAALADSILDGVIR